MKTTEERLSHVETLLGVHNDDPLDNSLTELEIRVLQAERMQFLLRSLLIELEALANIPGGSVKRIHLRSKILEHEHYLAVVEQTLQLIDHTHPNWGKTCDRKAILTSQLSELQAQLSATYHN